MFTKNASSTFSEQREIADILSAVDEKLEIERGGKAKLERIKHGLMGARVVFMKTEVCLLPHINGFDAIFYLE